MKQNLHIQENHYIILPEKEEFSMSDTSNSNMLGKLTNIQQMIEDYKEKIKETVTQEQMNSIKVIQIKIEKLISELPKEVYKFKKDDYMICSSQLQEILDSIKNIKQELEESYTGLERMKIITGIEKIEREVEICRNKAMNKVNK